VKTYNARDVIFSSEELSLTDGAPATGTFLEVARKTATLTTSTTLGHAQIVNVQNDRLGTFTLTLTYSADQNDALAARLALTESSKIPTTNAYMVKDHNGRTVHSMANGVIVGYPTESYGESGPTRVWVIEGLLEMNPAGGNGV
jgi:hypothetical protein